MTKKKPNPLNARQATLATRPPPPDAPRLVWMQSALAQLVAHVPHIDWLAVTARSIDPEKAKHHPDADWVAIRGAINSKHVCSVMWTGRCDWSRPPFKVGVQLYAPPDIFDDEGGEAPRGVSYSEVLKKDEDPGRVSAIVESMILNYGRFAKAAADFFLFIGPPPASPTPPPAVSQ